MILFLDKDPQRAVMAFNRMSVEDQNNTIWCRTAQEAITTFWDYREVLTEARLEHDLGDEPYSNTRSETCGMEVVRFLERKNIEESEEFEKLKKIRMVIHTYNDHAGPIMIERLRKLGFKTESKPFGL
jgi:hypothetical protein